MISPRSPGVTKQYEDFKASKRATGDDLTAFNLADEVVVREFTHWLIIENRFPYDNMTSVNHLLVPRRGFADWHDATSEERGEHSDIHQQIINERYYDAVVENFPRAKSVTRHVHVHLVRWKDTYDGN